jgi:hypothetical protein
LFAIVFNKFIITEDFNVIKVINQNNQQFPILLIIGSDRKVFTIKAACELLATLSKGVQFYMENPPESEEPKQQSASLKQQTKVQICPQCGGDNLMDQEDGILSCNYLECGWMGKL